LGGQVEVHNNTLYPALRRLEDAGAVSRTPEAQEGRPPRHVYKITELGGQLMHDMLVDLPPQLAASDQEFLTRVAFFGLLTAAERRSVLAARDQALRERLDHLRATASREDHTPWSTWVVAHAIDRLEAERAWVTRLGESDPAR
jgi:DNA-binding PadR family transcriptional regulator